MERNDRICILWKAHSDSYMKIGQETRGGKDIKKVQTKLLDFSHISKLKEINP